MCTVHSKTIYPLFLSKTKAKLFVLQLSPLVAHKVPNVLVVRELWYADK